MTVLREAGGVPIHGTEARYKRGCRCDYCRRASNACRRIRRQLATWRRAGAGESRAPRWFDVPVCCDCRRELGPDDAKVSAGTGWRCSDCEYARARSAVKVPA